MIMNTCLFSVERSDMKEGRDCKHIVSQQDFSCFNCGAPHPAKEKWDGWGVV